MNAARPNIAPDREVLTELNALHARALQRMPWVQAVVMLALGFVVWSPALARVFIVWTALTLAIEGIRARYASYVQQHGEALDPRRAHRRFIALAALAGLFMSSGVALVLPQVPILDQALLGIFVFAIPAAGVAVSQSSRYIVAAYTFTMVAPASLVWIRIHPTQLVTVGVGAFIFWILMILVAADGDRLLLRSVLIRHERDRLVQDLELKNAEVQVAVAKAEAAASARARVLAAASHDLRQPLHALSVYSAVLAANPEPAVLSEVGSHIVEMVRSLGSVLNGLLDLSRLSSGYYTPELQTVALDQVLAPVCSEFVAAAASKGLELQVDLQPALVRSDPVAVGRIARNLIDNAIKYTAHGSIRVSTRVQHGDGPPRALLDVTDTGKGIGASEQQRIFEEFYQVDNPGRDRDHGVGLGLAIVHRLAELLDATIAVRSAPGVGSTFEVGFAALPEASLSAPQVALRAIPDDIRGRRVYVVDDEVDVLRGTQALLNLWGLQVQGVRSGTAAEQLCAEQGAPDLMIADLRLGGTEHGAQLAARLQQRYGRFPVLIISGETSAAALREADRCSFPLLHKPVTAEAFQSAITLALAATPGTATATG